ncbi:MAG TPA: hypothetical protein VGL35_07505 [Rhizomicrobium sp.]
MAGYYGVMGISLLCPKLGSPGYPWRHIVGTEYLLENGAKSGATRFWNMVEEKSSRGRLFRRRFRDCSDCFNSQIVHLPPLACRTKSYNLP